jgi:hypothetical protein
MKITLELETTTASFHPDRPENLKHLAEIGQVQEGAAAVGVLRILACNLPAAEFKELVDFGQKVVACNVAQNSQPAKWKN